MFKQLHLDDWQLMLPGIGFVIFFTVFLYVALRVTRMPRPRAKHLAELPFEEETKKPAHEHKPKSDDAGN